MQLYCIGSSFFNALATALLGFLVFTRNRQDPRIRSFTLTAVFIVAWSIAYFFWQLETRPEHALLWCRLLSFFAVLIPPAYFDFTNALLRETRWRETMVGYTIAVIMALLSLTPWMVASVAPRLDFDFWPQPGPLYPFYLAVYFWYILRSVMLLVHAWRNSTGLRKNQMLYVLTMTVFGFAGGSTNFYLWYDIHVPPYGNVLVGVYMVGVAYAIVHLRLLEFNVLAARALVYVVLVALLGCIMPLGYLFLWNMSGGNMSLFWLLSVPSFIAVAIVFGTAPLLQNNINNVLDVRMSPSRATGRERLKSISSTLWLAQDEKRLLTVLGEGIAIAYGVTRFAVYNRRDSGSEALEVCFLSSDAEAHGWPRTWPNQIERVVNRHVQSGPLVVEEAIQSWGSPLEGIATQMRHTWGMRILLPIQVQDEPIALIVLGKFPESDVFSSADLDQLETLCLQAGLAITARRMERDRGLSEKLISLGTMAAGLAHEIRNPLTSLRTFCALVEEQGAQSEIAAEMIDVMRRDIDRISGIVDNVTHLATDTKAPTEPLPLLAILSHAMELSKRNPAHTAPITISGGEHQPTWVRANHNQLIQVFTNLFNNAQDALSGRPDGRISVVLARREPDVAVVAIRDNGPGIHPAVLRHLFEPFVTTKAVGERKRGSGMGLGLSIVRLLVQGHGGTISAENLPSGGAQFTIVLPIHKPINVP